MIKVISILIILSVLLLSNRGSSQIPIADVIKQGVTKAIKAVDLKVQRLQNQTIWLQNAQKVLENSMSSLHLGEITDWVQKQKDLYTDYYEGLSKVKSAVSLYHQVKDIASTQAQLVVEYKHAWNNIRQDSHFTTAELSYMSNVYAGILEQTTNNAGGLLQVVNSFVTQMSDAKRIEIINRIAEKVTANFNDLHQFNTQNGLLSLQRAKDMKEVSMIRTMYGLQ